MPELAEVRLTADFINLSASGIKFIGTWKNPAHKLQNLNFEGLLTPWEKFSISAKSRGKELKLHIAPEKSDEFSVIFTLGMSAHFSFEYVNDRPKHMHLSFVSSDEFRELGFVDVRRFGRWKIGDWNPDRSPDLTTEFPEWRELISSNLDHRDFKKPFYEWLMNQRWINGYGNYLRAELCERMDINPFWAAKDVIRFNPERFFQLAVQIPTEAYSLGGGQLYSWNNPLGLNNETTQMNWDEWMKAYKNPKFENLIDSGGRRFWYHPKWK